MKPASKALISGTGIVSVLTLLSRLLGFVRDMIVARLFGASMYADAFFVAFRIPNLLRSFVAEGALTSAFVPVFNSELAKGRGQESLRSVAGLLLSTTVLLTGLGLVFAAPITEAFAPGFNVRKLALATSLTKIMFPYIIFVSFVAMLNGALNSVQIFGASAWAQVWMNVVLIGSASLAAFFDPEHAIFILAISVLIGGVVQIVVQIPALRRAGFSIIPSRKIFTPATREVLKLMGPALIGASIYQILIYLNTVFASAIQSGSVSWLYYADRLAQLPIGVFSVALASVLLPSLARAESAGDKQDFSHQLGNSLRYTSFMVLPVALALFFWAKPITRLVYEGKEFNNHSTNMTAMALAAYSLGIWAVSCHSILAKAFLAKKDTVTTMLVGLFGLAINIILSLALMGPVLGKEGALLGTINTLQNALPFKVFDYGHVGLALASSLTSFASFAVLVALIRKRVSNLKWESFYLSTAKVIAGVLMTGICIKAVVYFTGELPTLMEICLGLVLYLLFSALLKNREQQETFALIRRLIK